MRRNHAQPLNFSQTVRKGTFPDDEFLDAIVEDIGFEEPAAAQPHAAPPQPVALPPFPLRSLFPHGSKHRRQGVRE